MTETRGLQIRVDTFPESDFGIIVTEDEFIGKSSVNPTSDFIHVISELTGFQDGGYISKSWIGNYESDPETGEQTLAEVGEKANQLIDKILGKSLLRTQTSQTGEKEISNIHNPDELALIATTTSLRDTRSLTRIQQARIKLNVMHIVNSIRRGYNRAKVSAIAKNIEETLRQSESVKKGEIEEVIFDPRGEEIKYYKPEEVSQRTKKEKKGLLRGFKINLFQDENGKIAEQQPIIYISSGKSEDSVALKCLNKDVNHLASGILDAERMRIEFPKGTWEKMTQAERDIAFNRIARIVQNIFGTNIISQAGHDTHRKGAINASSTPSSAQRTKLTLTHRPNIRPETIRKIAGELQSIILRNEQVQLILTNTGAKSIILPRRRSEIKTTIKKQLLQIGTELESCPKSKGNRQRKAELTTLRSQLEKVLDLINQIEEVIPESYDIQIPIDSNRDILTIGTESTREMEGVPLEIIIMEHVQWDEDSKDHKEYEQKKNTNVAKKLGLDPKNNVPQNADYIPQIRTLIKELAEIVLSDNTSRVVTPNHGNMEISKYAKLLLSRIIENPDNISELESVIAETGQKIRDALTEIIDQEITETDENRTHFRRLVDLALTE